MSFDPNSKSFADCLQRLRAGVDKAGLNVQGKIVTSKSTGVSKALEALAVDNVPDGFTKWQLPVFLERPSQMFITVAAPGSKVDPHSHDEGDGIRVIISGSIVHEGKELSGGDWMFIPKGVKYSFETGRYGATMFYCYSCCCA